MRQLAVGLAVSLAIASSAALPIAAPNQASASAPAAGVIAGRVVDASDGAPIGAATVSLRAPSSPGTGPVSVFILTTPEGQFTFTAVPAGLYTLTADRNGRGVATAASIDLHEGQQVRDVALKLWRPAQISGTLVDEANEPLAGVAVEVWRMRNPGAGNRCDGSDTVRAVTDDRGAYRVSVPPGRYLVVVPSTMTSLPLVNGRPPQAAGRLANTVSVPGSAANQLVGDWLVQGLLFSPVPPFTDAGGAIYVTTFYPAATSAADATTITVASGEIRSGIDLSLAAMMAGRVSGTLMGPAGPLANEGVFLMPAASPDPRTPAVSNALTDGQGRFALMGVPPGRFLVSSRANVRASLGAASDARGPTTELGMIWYRSEPITTASGDLPDVVLTMKPPVSISGRVQFEGPSPRPTAEQLGQPVIGFDLDTASCGSSNSGVAVAIFDPTGPLNGVMLLGPGRYHVLSTTFGSWYLRSLTVDGRDVLDEGIDIEAADRSGLVATFTDHPSRLSGVVRASATVIDPAAAVVIFPADSRRWTDARSARFKSVRAGHDGTYALVNLLPGDYCVAAIPADQTDDWMDESYLQTLSRAATRVQIGDRDSKTLDLRTVAAR